MILEEEKYKAIIAEIKKRHETGQPVLVGTIAGSVSYGQLTNTTSGNNFGKCYYFGTFLAWSLVRFLKIRTVAVSVPWCSLFLHFLL